MANKSTQFKKGQAKTGGRKKGSKNRTTEETRQLIQDIVNKKLDNLEEDLKQMSPFSQWQVVEKLTKYFLPALSKNDNKTEHSGAMKIVVEYLDQKKVQDNDGADS